jgi:hypothetical protein
MRNTHAHFTISSKARNLALAGGKISIHFLQYRIKISSFTFLARSDILYICLFPCGFLILYVCSTQSNTRSMTSEEERLARLRRTLHSLATRVPKIILTRVDRTFPVLKNQAVSVMHSILCIYI